MLNKKIKVRALVCVWFAGHLSSDLLFSGRSIQAFKNRSVSSGNWNLAPELTRSINCIDHLHQGHCLIGVVRWRRISAERRNKIAELQLKSIRFVLLHLQRYSDQFAALVFKQSQRFKPDRRFASVKHGVVGFTSEIFSRWDIVGQISSP